MAKKPTLHFDSATPCPHAKGVSPLPEQNFGPKANWPSATEAPKGALKDTRGPGPTPFESKPPKLHYDSSTAAPLPKTGTSELNRPTPDAKAYED
jgi:hypothetical protein